MPLMYFALKTWVHNMKWPDMRPAAHTRLPDAHVLSVHRVLNALQAELVVAAFDHFEQPNASSYVCQSCSQWSGWSPTHLAPYGALSSWEIACCHRTPSQRSQADIRGMNTYLKQAAIGSSRRMRRRRSEG